MAERRIRAVHERDLEGLLKSLNLLESLRTGKVKCAECQCEVTEKNLGFIYPFKGEIRVCCDNLECFYEVMLKIRKGQKPSGERNDD